ncbi:MAG: hypothetical protein FP816_15780 [Desulfobacteraceae bacterium]|nr:hypothetical protein [Desulfobacteraceae bacterium]MBU3948981.1 hypothetical protein [Pseudomonadota bacterium]
MSDYTASIRRIGLINSGMFDTLSLNFDVKAIHLVGANNVGKTSLIAVIQFLFFPNFNEMTFIKSSGESMGFYFRPEGSYILFEVRTITGSIRTVGIYGTGESDGRVNFVFNGGFDLNEFLSEESTPKPLQELQAVFFSRNFHRFDRFERYEEALLGLHTHGEYNVPMFDLSKTNFRLLRKLMQGLLRLDRIDAAEVQDLLVRIVERGAVKTRFNMLQDFEQKYRHINQVRIELRELEALKPVVARYQKIRARIGETEEKRRSHSERLFHLSSVYMARLEKEKETLAREFKTQETQHETLGEQIKARMKRIGDAESALASVKEAKERLEALTEICRQHSESLIRRERDERAHAKVVLENALSTARPQNIPDLKRQLMSIRRELAGARRRMEAKTLQQVWVDAGFDEMHRALLSFLVSNDLSSLSASDCMQNRQAFVDASLQAADYLDAEGNFKGFGLNVPRSLWFVPEMEQEPLMAQCDRLEENMAKIHGEIDIAENQEKKRQELSSLTAEIQARDTLLGRFTELANLSERWESPENIETKHAQQADELKQLGDAVDTMEAEARSLRQTQHRTHSALEAAEARWRQVCREHESLTAFTSVLPEILDALTLEALRDEYTLVRGNLSEIVKSLDRYQMELDEPRVELEARYEKSGADVGFEKWLVLKTNLAGEITGLEAQLTREYEGIFTVVRAKLSKITQAYESVEAEVAALNKGIRNVRISNIEQIGIALEKTSLLDAIDLSVPGQLDLFATRSGGGSLEEAHAQVEDYFNHIKQYGNEINLKDMFRIKFSVKFNHQAQPVERYEIHRFESNGTETGVKIVIYLGLIGLLQERKNVVATRIPFFLDEVGSIDSENLNQLIAYCSLNNFLPIFASPEIRKDISCNYLFRRNGSRSLLASVVKISERKPSAGST